MQQQRVAVLTRPSSLEGAGRRPPLAGPNSMDAERPGLPDLNNTVLRNYRLFGIQKLLSVRTVVEQGDERRPSDPEQARIGAVAAAEGAEFHLLAVASGSSLIFRYTTDAGSTPLVRQMTWFQDPKRHVRAMAFDPGAEYLLCVTADATVFIVPAYELVVGSMLTGDTTPSLTEYALHGGTAHRHVHLFRGPTKDVDCVPIGKTAAHSKPLCCVWWMSRQGSHYAIVGFDGGEVLVVDLEHKTSARSFRLKQAVRRVDLLADPLGTCTWAMIHGDGKSSWKLLLEQQQEDSTFENLVSHPSDNQFSLEAMSQFPPGCLISMQETKQGPTIAVQHPDAKIEVFGCELSKYAMFVFQVCPGMELVHMSDKFLFTVSGQHRNRFSVMSRLLAGTSSTGPVHHPREAIMQEFRLPHGQQIQGLLQTQCSVVVAAAPESPTAKGVKSPSVYLWSQDTIYECAMDMRPEEIFKRLVRGGLERNHAEPLGKTLGLDLLGLYQEVAEEYFEAGEHERALSIYFLSNVDPGELAQKFINVGRMDVAVMHLRDTLRKEEDLPPKTRDHLSSLLLGAHLHLLMDGNAKDLPEIEAATERLCQAGVGSGHSHSRVLELLQHTGLFKQLLLLGDAHGAISDVLDIAMRSHVQLPSSSIQQLIESNHSLLVQRHPIFEHLSRKQQTRLLLHNIFSNSVEVVPQLYATLPHLDTEDLIQVAQVVDPHGVNSGPVAALGAPDAALELGSDTMGSEEMGYLLTELYLAAFLHINANEVVEVATAGSRRQGGGRWGQTALRAALWSHFGHYRANRLIPYCLDLENESAAASVYEMLSYWPEAISCHLKACLMLFTERTAADASRSWDESDLVEAMTPLLSPLLKASTNSSGSVINVRPMLQVLMFWRDQALPTSTLEEFLLLHVDVLAPILGTLAAVHDRESRELLDSGAGNQGEWAEAEDGVSAIRTLELEEVMQEAGMALNNELRTDDDAVDAEALATETHDEHDDETEDGVTDSRGLDSSLTANKTRRWHFPAWVHQFSTKLHLAVAAAELQRVARGDLEAQGHEAESQTWREITDVVEAKLAHKDHRRILLPGGCIAEDEGAMLTGPGMPGWRGGAAPETADDSSDTIVFTCGHKFDRAHYISHIVPAFKQRLEGLPCSQPVAFAACIEVALQANCTSACPPCCFNRFRNTQLNNGAWKTAVWTP